MTKWHQKPPMVSDHFFKSFLLHCTEVPQNFCENFSLNFAKLLFLVVLLVAVQMHHTVRNRRLLRRFVAQIFASIKQIILVVLS